MFSFLQKDIYYCLFGHVYSCPCVRLLFELAFIRANSFGSAVAAHIEDACMRKVWEKCMSSVLTIEWRFKIHRHLNISTDREYETHERNAIPNTTLLKNLFSKIGNKITWMSIPRKCVMSSVLTWCRVFRTENSLAKQPISRSFQRKLSISANFVAFGLFWLRFL